MIDKLLSKRMLGEARHSFASNPSDPGQETVSWAPDDPGWVLQESLTLEPPAWTNAPSASTNPVTVPASPPEKFYRLHRP